MKKALVLGAGGQAGWYMCQLLLDKGYQVFGTMRPGLESVESPKFHPCSKVTRFYSACLTAPACISNFIDEADPDEVYNFVGRMFAPASWGDPSEYLDVNGDFVVRLLHILSAKPNIRFFNAGSGEMYSRRICNRIKITEESPLKPSSPYALSKEVAYRAVKMYREEKGMHASTGIFFNMESPRRSTFFFAEKVCQAAVRIANGTQDHLEIGALHAHRDWGLTREYVAAAWEMAQAALAGDYIVSTGVTKSCAEFVEAAFKAAGVTGHIAEHARIRPAPKFISEPFDRMYTSPKKIKDCLGWEAKTKFEGVVKELVQGYQEQLQAKAVGAQ